MGYNAVPTVATGDPWTAANHNTYIRDNFAAGVPDIFTTKGDLAVASAANAASRLGVGSNYQVLMADSAEANGVKWAENVVMRRTGALGNTSWDGDSKSVGTTTVVANTFSGTIPTNAKGVLVSVSAKWAAANSASTLDVRPTGATGSNCLKVRALVANYWMDAIGWVPLDANGRFDVVVNNASVEVYLEIWGWVI